MIINQSYCSGVLKPGHFQWFCKTWKRLPAQPAIFFSAYERKYLLPQWRSC